MDQTKATLCRLFAALPSPAYSLGILDDRGMYRLEAIPETRILRMLPYLKHRNAAGAHIYLRPAGESAYTLLDDLTGVALARLRAEGYDPAAVVETSPGNFQAWLRHPQPLSKELGTLAAKTLAAQFGGDPGAADWRRFGRAPSFTNRKPKYRSPQGHFPFTRLASYAGQVFPSAVDFGKRLLSLHKAEQERLAFLRSRPGRPSHFSAQLTLAHFRSLPRYAGQPAAADMAFSVAAYANGWSERDIVDALRREYLSRDTSRNRQAEYIRRTLAKARGWAL